MILSIEYKDYFLLVDFMDEKAKDQFKKYILKDRDVLSTKDIDIILKDNPKTIITRTKEESFHFVNAFIHCSQIRDEFSIKINKDI